jgi:cellulose synthase/poly-beta-1,6-N-acetylglucosamine synthase-like glycosyltransferase
MIALEFAFWIGICLLAWTWAGYPMALGALAWQRRRTVPGASSTTGPINVPHITMIVPVYNAELAIEDKLINCLALDYPAGRFDILVVSDGSTDGSVSIARSFAEAHSYVRLIESEGRVGKSAAQNLAAAKAVGEILFLTDVDAVLRQDALRLIARNFRHPDVGCVTGRVVWESGDNRDRAQSENLYWRLEHAIWAREDALGTLACASGSCMAVRRAMFREIDPQYGDDVVLPLEVLRQGAYVAYEPDLVTTDKSALTSAAALRARARMTLRSLQGTWSRRAVYSPLQRPGLCATVVSHKLLRWMTPFLLLGVLGSAIPLAVIGQPAGRCVLVAQCAWVAAAVIGRLAQRSRVHIPLAGAAYEFALENVGMFIGVARAVLGHRQIAYRPGGR